jgi:hypothetical protein
LLVSGRLLSSAWGALRHGRRRKIAWGRRWDDHGKVQSATRLPGAEKSATDQLTPLTLGRGYGGRRWNYLKIEGKKRVMKQDSEKPFTAYNIIIIKL